MLLNLLRPLLVENLNYKAKQPTFHFGKEKNNTSFQLHYRPGPVIYCNAKKNYAKHSKCVCSGGILEILNTVKKGFLALHSMTLFCLSKKGT